MEKTINTITAIALLVGVWFLWGWTGVVIATGILLVVPLLIFGLIFLRAYRATGKGRR
ncbi:MAG: hypothetical protein WBA46_14335 [Thermomicrobiales bacterium]